MANQVFLIGNVCNEIELQKTSSDISYCRINLAVSRSYSTADGQRETDFFNIMVWRGLAENCGKYLKKGTKISVVGSIQNRVYEDKDGNKRTTTDIIAKEIEFLTRVKENDEEESNAYSNKRTSQAKPSSIEQYDDDLPF